MKKFLLFCLLLISVLSFSQTNSELKTDIEEIKSEIQNLKTEIQSVKSQNIYLKKALDINSPILELESNGSDYRITKVIGNKKEKTISIYFLIESNDENKTASLQEFTLIDLVGNPYEIDFRKSSNVHPKLTLNVPLKIKITFKEIIDEPKMIKLFKFDSTNKTEGKFIGRDKSILEFKDLNVTWE